MSTTACHAREIFLEALDRSPGERERFVIDACAGDTKVMREVEGLFAAFVRAEHELEPLSTPAPIAPNGDCPAGPLIRNYRIQRPIASGGMGIVYEAIQENPRRTVALKVMRRGLVSPAALRRFKYEAQILARLRHPNIAQIYEAGMHDDGAGGVPWFAMEHIANARTITIHAAAVNLDLRARLKLFIKVCEAVHHGHQKGIIHRDLKPANILVDQAGDPKVIDFGVARATDTDLALTTIETEPGQLLGTMQYMSPEQCATDPHDVDVRSDVYSLGVVLYELLSGQRPYDLSRTPIIQAPRIIIEAAPARPSSIDRRLRGDIETIVLKALEKDRARRYQSATELADDLRRYLRAEPIMARPASAAYLLRMFARRHRALCAATAITAAALVAAAVIAGGFWIETRAARDLNARLADYSLAFLGDQLGESVQIADQAREPELAAAMIKSFEKDLVARFQEFPELLIRFRQQLAWSYQYIGAFSEAEEQLNLALQIGRESLSEGHSTTIASMLSLADVQRDMARHADAEQTYRTTMELIQLKLPREQWDPVVWSKLGDMLHDIGRSEEAIGMHREAIDILARQHGRDNHMLCYYLPMLAGVHADLGEFSEAEDLVNAALRIAETAGEYELARPRREMARLALLQGRSDEARQWCQLAETDYAFDSVEPLLTLELGGLIDFEEGRIEPAMLVFADAARQADSILRSELAWWAAHFRTNQARCLVRLQRYSEAEPMLRDAYSLLRDRLGEPHHRTQNCIRAIIELLEATGRTDEVESWRAKLRQ